jgi:MFS transporter, ACS family, solute carrier family 17 (sodium-dependent inorganic phosphate cotransporter), other
MDRVNMSIAILPMAETFGWSSTTIGLVQSSFFWGYLLTQVAGGVWADKFGGKVVLGFGVVWWSLATVLTPFAAHLGLPVLLAARACMGIGEGVAMPAMNNLLSKWVPVRERSRSLALVYSGMYTGSVFGLALSPHMIHAIGWPSVFYVFGVVGVGWFYWWIKRASSSPMEDTLITSAERKYIARNTASQKPIGKIPWKLLLSKPPVWALIISHFCHNWGTFILLTWMPTYYNQVLGLDLKSSGFFSVLPWITMAIASNVGGWIADTLVERGWSVTTVRKVMQTIGFLGPAFFLTQLGKIHTVSGAVACMMASQGLDAFSQSGLYSNHQDIGPRYAGVLLGMSNTAGVLAGVLGTAATGFILQNGTWDEVWGVAVALYLVGTVVWNVFSTGEKVFD